MADAIVRFECCDMSCIFCRRNAVLCSVLQSSKQGRQCYLAKNVVLYEDGVSGFVGCFSQQMISYLYSSLPVVTVQLDYIWKICSEPEIKTFFFASRLPFYLGKSSLDSVHLREHALNYVDKLASE